MDYYQTGGAPAPVKEFVLGNISKFTEAWDTPLILFSILTIDVIILFLARYVGLGRKSLNKWYDTFGLSAVLANVLSIFLGFVIARFIYTGWLDARFGWNPIYFVLLLVLIQVIHDIIFYFLVIRPIKQGTNEMIDVFKLYAKEHGAGIISADAIMMISSATLAMVMKHQSVGVQAFVFGLATYALPYILYTEPQWDKKLIPPPTKKEESKNDDYA